LAPGLRFSRRNRTLERALWKVPPVASVRRARSTRNPVAHKPDFTPRRKGVSLAATALLR
ncbi:MAG TPA: hypothetical protein VNZ63_03025, partial [Verrucomicrobiae bacterium]|nr:hypothetical protein [Verrucomicrobiae bacterium]